MSAQQMPTLNKLSGSQLSGNQLTSSPAAGNFAGHQKFAGYQKLGGSSPRPSTAPSNSASGLSMGVNDSTYGAGFPSLGRPIELSEWNQKTYDRLKQSLGLDLRRQVFVAVCDDLVVRAHLSQRLIRDRAMGTHRGELISQVVTVTLDAQRPSLQQSIFDGFQQYRHTNQHYRPMPQGYLTSSAANHDPVVQLFGIEDLTRQSAHIQRQFLQNLNQLPKRPLPAAGALILWVTRPWANSICQSAPDFWQWHTGFFEFDGDPRPFDPEADDDVSSQPSFQPQLDPIQAFPWQDSPGSDAAGVDSTEITALLSQKLLPQRGEQVKDSQLAFQSASQPVSSQPAPNSFALNKSASNKPAPNKPAPNQRAFNNASPKFPTDAPVPNALDAWLVLAQSAQGAPGDRRLMDRAIEIGHQLLADHRPTLFEQAQIYETLGHCHSARALTVTRDQRRRLGDTHQRAIARDLQKACDCFQWALKPLDKSLANRALERRDGQNNQLLKRRANLLRTLAETQQSLVRYGGASNADKVDQYQESAVKNYRQGIASQWLKIRRRRKFTDGDAQWLVQTYNSLGMAYWAQGNGDRSNAASAHRCFKRAVHAYLQGLGCYGNRRCSDSVLPTDYHYGTLQTNLGTAYLTLHRGDRNPQWLDHAVTAYHAALNYRDRQQYPAAYAATCNNLGIAYRALGHFAQRQDPHAEWTYCQQGIAFYNEALAIESHIPVTFDRATAARHLAQLHQYLAQHGLTSESASGMGDRSSADYHLGAAVEAYSHGLRHLSKGASEHPLLNGLIATVKTLLRGSYGSSPQTVLAQVPSQWRPRVLKQL
ncbi:MAG: hypothetical protein AAF685_04915 [Cyanobacteria bacterium P01_C01_bin.89]